jgi:hypothetical protein
LPWPFYAFWVVGHFGLAAMDHFEWGKLATLSCLTLPLA